MSAATQEEKLKQAVMAATRAIARKAALNVRYGGNQPTDFATGDEITLPLPPDEPDVKSLRLLRAEADYAALSLRYHDSVAHQKQRPLSEKAGSVFDALEQVRVMALGANAMNGVKHNLFARNEQRYEDKGYHRLSERADPPLADIIAAMAYEQLTSEPPPPTIRNLVSLWRGWIEQKSGNSLAGLANLLDDQPRFSLKVLKLLDELELLESGQSGTGKLTDSNDDSQTEALSDDVPEDNPMPPMPSMSAEGDSEPEGSATAPQPALMEDDETTAGKEDKKARSERLIPNFDKISGTNATSFYNSYTTKFDEVIAAEKLASPEELTKLRLQLDQKLAQYHSITSRLAGRLQRLLLAQQARSWEFDQEDGLINSARLTQLVVRPDYRHIYKREKDTSFKDTVVTLLLDNSGSMRGRPITVAALSADILARTLERCGIKVEILGFTTRDWKGGSSRKAWMEAGRPAEPGRLNDLRHIIYKSADARFNRARRNLALMLKDGILKENIDGEAIQWAYNRLRARKEQRRILMVISDGAPVDDSTLSANSGSYLDLHLREVIANIEQNDEVELLAIGIGHDVTRYYKRAVTITDVDKLGDTMMSELGRLFAA